MSYSPIRPTARNFSDMANNSINTNLITPGFGIEPSALQFDLVRICSDRLKMIENYNENFNVDVNANNIQTYVRQSGSNLSFDSSNNVLNLTNIDVDVTKVEDADIGITYSPVRIANDANFSGGTEHVIKYVGEYIEYQFTGTGIRYYADKYSDHGIANIYIDDVLVGTADGYAGTAQYQQLLFSISGLSYGNHTIKISVTNNKNANSTGIFVTLDFFEVFSNDILIKVPVKYVAPGFALRMTIKDDSIVGTSKTSSRLGLVKDENNWLMCSYNKTDGKIHIIAYIDGVYSEVATATVYEEVSAPYEIIMLVKNNDLTFIINKDNNMKGYAKAKYTGIQLKDPTVLSQFTLGFGAKIAIGESLYISNIKSGYDQGMTMGSDYKLITYEDGSPLKHDNSYYFTASEHSTNSSTAGAGALVYKININSLNVELVGIIFSKVSENDVHGDQTCKVIYDRNKKYFIYLANNFQNSQAYFTIGKTTTNLLTGINIIPVQDLIINNIVSNDVWDADVIYDSETRKYKMVYSSNWYLVMAEADDVYDSWTVTKTSSIQGEGSIFFKINGQFYITWSPKPHNSILKVYDLDFNYVTNLNIDKFPSTNSSSGAFPWGFILPVQNATETSFYLFLFSMRKWWNLLYAYGDLWIYKAKQIENGVEFKENNKLMF